MLYKNYLKLMLKTLPTDLTLIENSNTGYIPIQEYINALFVRAMLLVEYETITSLINKKNKKKQKRKKTWHKRLYA